LSLVAVIGGGITGLAAAHHLAKDGAEVVVLESDDRLGGKVLTERHGNLTVEAGPDSFLDREPAAASLCRELGLGAELVSPARFGALVWTGTQLARLPTGLPHGIPSSPYEAWRSGLLSRWGALRACADLFNPRPVSGPDLSLGEFVAHRFGPEVLENLVDPLLAGTRAGEAESLSLAAATPVIDSLARRNRSLIAGLRGQDPTATPPFLAIGGGMDRLVERLAATLAESAEVRTGGSVARIQRATRGFELQLASGGTLEAQGVILAVPAFAAAAILAQLSPRAAALLATIQYANVASVTLVYPPGSWTPPEGTSGLLVSRAARATLAACSWTSHKWPDSAPSDGSLVMRCFAGRSGADPALQAPDDELARQLAADLRAAIRLNDSPVRSTVTRWERGLPQYTVGHLERVTAAERALDSFPGVGLAGAGYRGSGLPDCIRQGQEAAARVLEHL
jgi:protoporphyrinogen/coproporphyrinogen III oxidase